MYRKADRQQLSLEEFNLPFGGRLSADNRWVKLSKIMPWELIEDLYELSFDEDRADGRPPVEARMAYGSLHIKESEKIGSDERALDNIAENPYMQYFVGLKEFRQERLFDPSLMTHIRKRFTAEMIAEINLELYRRMKPQGPGSEPEGKGNGKDDDEGNDTGNASSEPENKGTMILDATVAPADVRYPTDLSLLNESRENTEEMIDELWGYIERKGHKTGYFRKKARSKYLKVAKQRKPRKKAIKKAIREQLGYVKKNLETLDGLMGEAESVLPKKRLERLATIRKVAAQQEEMLKANSNSVEGRIVNLRQPHVRPIVRGKARTPVEFGQKLAFSVVDGFTFIDRWDFDNFNEGTVLIEHAELYRERFGVFPKSILADTIYRNRENRQFCKVNGIRLSGPKLGRPKASEVEAEKEQAYRDSCDRNMVESRNGIAKRRFGLDLIMARLEHTAFTEAALNVLVMNCALVLRVLLRIFPKCSFAGCFCSVYGILWMEFRAVPSV